MRAMPAFSPGSDAEYILCKKPANADSDQCQPLSAAANARRIASWVSIIDAGSIMERLR